MTPADEKNSAEFLACVVELIRAHGRHPGRPLGAVLFDALVAKYPSASIADRLFFCTSAELATAVREFADKSAPVALQAPAPSSCQNHSDCEAADAARASLGVQIRHVPWTAPAAVPSAFVIGARSCNLHADCDAADVAAMGRTGNTTKTEHCHSADCEECFPK